MDFTPFFKKYEVVSGAAEEVYKRVKKEYPECIRCKTKCSDCCYALFDLTLIEALYLNHRFNEKFEGKEKDVLINKSNKADREIYKIKRKAHKELEAGKDEAEIIEAMAKERIRCPLLNEDDMCDLYEYRPVTCRLYGIPTLINGRGHTCGFSGFVEGKEYPTVNLDIIQNRLYQISAELVKEIKTRYVKMDQMLVPLSMAVITVYDEKYLGTEESEGRSDVEKKGEGDE
jgi:Fe-S-cluster containining protein